MIEQAFNTIWRVKFPRSLRGRFSGYLGVVLIGPVLVFAAPSITATWQSNLSFVICWRKRLCAAALPIRIKEIWIASEGPIAKGTGIDLREPDGFDELLLTADSIGCRETR
jgi:hypothetical protein